MPRISTKLAARREAYVYNLFAKKPGLPVKEAIQRLTDNKQIGGMSMAVGTAYKIRKLALAGAGLPVKVVKSGEIFGGVTGTTFQSAADINGSSANAEQEAA